MKLQINQRGSWRDVVEFDDDKAIFIAVGEAALTLARAIAKSGDGKPACFRITEPRRGGSPRVIAYLDAPYSEWKKR